MIKDLGRSQVLRQCRALRTPEILPFCLDAFASDHALESSGFTAIPRDARGTGHKHVADFARSPGPSSIGTAVQDEACANTGSNRNEHEIAYTLCRPRPAFTDGRKVHIVIHGGRRVEG